MPEIDANAFDRRTVGGGNNLKGKRKRRAFAPFGDVGAHELRIEIERALHRLRREDAHLGAGERRGDGLAGSRARASASGWSHPERRRRAGQGLAPRQAGYDLFPVLAHDLLTKAH